VLTQINELIISRPRGWEGDLKKIKAVSRIEMDQTLIASEFAKLFDQFGKEDGVLKRLKDFTQGTDYKPEAETVQAKYRDILTSERYNRYNTEDLIRDIYDLTGIQPEKQILMSLWLMET